MPSYMETSRNYFYNLRKYGLNLSTTELKGFLITIIVTAFVYSFRDWGGESFNFGVGILNLIVAILIVGFAFMIGQIGQRLIAVYYGYNPTYEFSVIGVMISVVIAFASRGLIVIIIPGVITIHHLAASRLGEFRYYTNLYEWAKVSFGGPLLNFFVAVLFSIIPTENAIIHKIMMINLLFAIFSMLPMPLLFPGGHIFYNMKYMWAFGAVFIIVGSILLMFVSAWIAIVVGLLLGILAIVWYFFVRDAMVG